MLPTQRQLEDISRVRPESFPSSDSGSFYWQTSTRHQHGHLSARWPKLREADMKCKVNLFAISKPAFELAAEATSAQMTRRRKLTAEKSVRPNVDNEFGCFALGDSFAHMRPSREWTTCLDTGHMQEKMSYRCHLAKVSCMPYNC